MTRRSLACLLLVANSLTLREYFIDGDLWFGRERISKLRRSESANLCYTKRYALGQAQNWFGQDWRIFDEAFTPLVTRHSRSVVGRESRFVQSRSMGWHQEMVDRDMARLLLDVTNCLDVMSCLLVTHG